MLCITYVHRPHRCIHCHLSSIRSAFATSLPFQMTIYTATWSLTYKIASLWHSTQAGSIPIACEGVVGRRVSKAIVICTGCNHGAIPRTIFLLVENANAIVWCVAIGNVDTASIVVVVTVVASVVIVRPCYINLRAVVGAARIGVVVDLHLFSCWADSQKSSQICKTEELHNDNFEELWQTLESSNMKEDFFRPTSFVCQDTVVEPAEERIAHGIDRDSEIKGVM